MSHIDRCTVFLFPKKNYLVLYVQIKLFLKESKETNFKVFCSVVMHVCTFSCNFVVFYALCKFFFARLCVFPTLIPIISKIIHLLTKPFETKKCLQKQKYQYEYPCNMKEDRKIKLKLKALKILCVMLPK
ncbi:hypothetical protein RFI_03316 [Reticulomyxa filosa]|uniref:Uncharacterized protein n=1 Tax=Reticulomyxa filosa TaxID=46433 RepID=X6P5F6_RETFI|nr:hypothetical protein RFI_03316 [Reticulomyxa filosa]|eukprot:ETO33785.1 hypothetical protein RFI_03316 [Reticulomyxa filosa]